MKALSIKQPWASLIVHGIKDIENRTWKTNFRGRIYVHTSISPAFTGSYTDNLPDGFWTGLTEEQRRTYLLSFQHRGFIIGEIDIIDCVINHESIWAEKTEGVTAGNQFFYKKPIYNWVLANPVLYEKPIPAKGKLSLWEPDFEIVECIGCSGKFNHEEMSQDDADENYCPECWSHFKPILKAEYDELKANGEID